MTWTDHLELLMEAVEAVSHLYEGCTIPAPDCLTEAFCMSEAVVGQIWESQP
jgi:hypothetical protein